MPIGQQNRPNWRVRSKRWWRCVLRAQRKWRRCDGFVRTVRKEAGDSTKRPGSEIVKESEPRAKCSIPVSYSEEVIGNSESGRHISKSSLIERCAARLQGDGHGIQIRH